MRPASYEICIRSFHCVCLNCCRLIGGCHENGYDARVPQADNMKMIGPFSEEILKFSDNESHKWELISECKIFIALV